MRIKNLIIISSCLNLAPAMTLTACSNQEEEQTKSHLESIEIVSDLSDIKLESQEIYLSKPIEVKCFDNNKKEIEQKTQLFLYSPTENNLDIKIIDNKIHIGQHKTPGLYKYKLIATIDDFSIISNIKEINIQIYEQIKEPDFIELKGIDNLSLEYPTSKTIQYELVAKSRGETIQDYDPRSNFEVNITLSSSGKTKDTFNNPIFSLEQKDKTFVLSTSKNIDKSYEGTYCIDIKVSLLSNPFVTTIKTINLKLVYGIEYIDSSTQYVYSRQDVESQWSLNSIPSNLLQLDKSKILNSINGIDVNRIENNFCSNSSIKTFIIFDPSDQIKSIGSYAFYKQEALTSFYIENIEYVEESAFEGCTLGSSNPDWQLKIKFLGQNAFKDCKDFEPKYMPDAIYLGESCLKGIGSSYIHFGQNLAVICPEALYDCPNLKDVYIKSTIPPYLMGDFIGGSTPTNFKIHVPSNSIQNYRNDTNWSIYSENLVGDITM